MRNRYKALLLAVLILNPLGINAEEDFSAKEEHYLKLCASASGFRDNKVTCEAFQTYLNNKISDSEVKASDIKNKIEDVKGNIEKTQLLIQENEALIANYEVKITTLETSIKAKEEEFVNVEDGLIANLGFMQEISMETLVYDFLMGTITLDQFFLQIDALNAINQKNKDIMLDLETISKSLETEKITLEDTNKELVISKENQEVMVKELKDQEVVLMEELNTVEKMKELYDSRLDNINVEEIVQQIPPNPPIIEQPTNPGGGDETVTPPPSQVSLTNPVKHGTVTTVPWYYDAELNYGWHPGIDIANSTGTPIYSPANGIVLLSNYGGGGGYGNFVVTAHQVGNDTYTYLYAHLSSSIVTPGEIIGQDQVIAYMGNTGNSTGPHLHLEIFKHTGRDLTSVVNSYRNSGDYFFGLAYTSIGSCSYVCRLAPQELLGLYYGQVY